MVGSPGRRNSKLIGASYLGQGGGEKRDRESAVNLRIGASEARLGSNDLMGDFCRFEIESFDVLILEIHRLFLVCAL
jgi:hypothetical protein